MSNNRKARSLRRVLTTLLVAALIAPTAASAAWNSQADRLPGLVSGKKIGILAGVAGAGVVTLIILKKKRKKKQQPEQASVVAAPRPGRKPATFRGLGRPTALTLTPVKEVK